MKPTLCSALFHVLNTMLQNINFCNILKFDIFACYLNIMNLRPHNQNWHAVCLLSIIFCLYLYGSALSEKMLNRYGISTYRVESPKPDQFFAISLRLGLCQEHSIACTHWQSCQFLEWSGLGDSTLLRFWHFQQGGKSQAYIKKGCTPIQVFPSSLPEMGTMDKRIGVRIQDRIYLNRCTPFLDVSLWNSSLIQSNPFGLLDIKICHDQWPNCY